LHGDEQLRNFYRELLALRRTLPRSVELEADDDATVLLLHRGEVNARLQFAAPPSVDLSGAGDVAAR
jgi:hypothetical protein